MVLGAFTERRAFPSSDVGVELPVILMHPKPADGKWCLGRSESTREEKADPVQMGAGNSDGTGQPQRLGTVLHRMSQFEPHHSEQSLFFPFPPQTPPCFPREPSHCWVSHSSLPAILSTRGAALPPLPPVRVSV